MKKYLTCCALSFLFFLNATFAQVLMFDFGKSTIDSGNLKKSPYHAADTAFTGVKWNYVAEGSADSFKADVVYNNLYFADNSAATGVSLSFGYALGSTKARFDSAGTIRSISPSASNGIFGNNNQAANDFILIGDSNGQKSVLGLRISGLGAGTYDLYMVGAHATSGGVSMNFWATTSNAVEIDIASSTFLSDSHTVASPAIPNTKLAADTFVSGTNYAKLTITLEAGDVLTILSRGAGSDQRGFFNSLQVVAVPEPGTLALLGLGALALTASVLRRARR